MKMDPATSKSSNEILHNVCCEFSRKNSNIIWRHSLVYKLYALCSRWMFCISKRVYL